MVILNVSSLKNGRKRLILGSSRFRDVSIVSVTVGSAKTPFRVHRDLLCDESPFFKAAFAKEFKEASEGILDLPEDDVDTFDRFIQWMYSGEYGLSGGFETHAEADERYNQLARLYILADKLQVPRLKNDVVNKFFEVKVKARCVPRCSTVSYIFKNSLNSSLLRKLMVDWYAWDVDLVWYGKDGIAQNLSKCPEFAAGLTIALAMRLVDLSRPSPLDEPKTYHEGVKDP